MTVFLWAAVACSAGLALALALPGAPAHERLRALRPGAAPGGGRPPSLPRKPAGLRMPFSTGQEERRRRAVVDVCRTFAAELRGGQPPSAALATAASELPPGFAAEFAEIAAHAREGHDPGAALRRAAAVPGAAGLGRLAACWEVAAATGAAPADIADRLAAGLAEEARHRRELAAQLAGPKATAVLLFLLPLLGVAMAGALGTRPLAFLFTTPLGLACLALGAGLDLVGMYWTLRMVRTALDAHAPRGDRAEGGG